jgi:pyroglutamyl-peptidase
MMKKLLITGFDPFGGETVNPSWEAVRLLPERIGEYDLTKLQIPTEFSRASEAVLMAAEALQPDAILCVGQAGGRAGITPEVVGINLREARIPDNGGAQPVNEPVVKNGPAAYFATLPVREMVKALSDRGIPASLSYSAGAFVCNDVLYSVLHRYSGTRTMAGFVHVPFLPEQAKEGVASMALETIAEALEIAIEQM